MAVIYLIRLLWLLIDNGDVDGTLPSQMMRCMVKAGSCSGIRAFDLMVCVVGL